MFLVNRFAAAIDMIAAGTSAPMPMAAKAMPANQLGNMLLEQLRDDRVAVGADRLGARRDRHVAEQRDQASAML